MTGEDVKHLDKVLPITPWTSLNLEGDNDIQRFKKEVKNDMYHEQGTILEQ